jgi:hypothetical protein
MFEIHVQPEAGGALHPQAPEAPHAIEIAGAGAQRAGASTIWRRLLPTAVLADLASLPTVSHWQLPARMSWSPHRSSDWMHAFKLECYGPMSRSIRSPLFGLLIFF